MKYHKFNNDFMNTLLDKLTIENMPFLILGDFNLNLLSNNYIPHKLFQEESQKNQPL